MIPFLEQRFTLSEIALFQTVLIAVALILICRFSPSLDLLFFGRIERFFSRLASRKRLAVLIVFFLAIAARLALLPALPVPVPGVHDEFSYLLQADTFAHGRLANPPHPLWKSFETFHENWFPTYSGMFPPAQSVVLAFGEILGSPWVGVLLSDALMCALIVWMLQGWLPPRWALLGGLLAFLKLGVVSYWMNSYWGGAVAAAAGALVMGALPRIVKRRSFAAVIYLGVGLAVLANSRPFEGLLFSLAPLGALFWWLWKDKKVAARWKWQAVVAPLALMGVLVAAGMGYYNLRLTGNALLFPHTHNWDTYLSSGLFLWDKNGPEKQYRNPQLDEYYNHWTRDHYHRGWQDARFVTAEKFYNYRVAFLWPGAILLLIGAPIVLVDRKMRLWLVTLAITGIGLLSVVWSMPHYAAPLACIFFGLFVQALRHIRALKVGRPWLGLGFSRAIVILLAIAVVEGFTVDARRPSYWSWNGDMGMHTRQQVLEKLQSLPGKQLAIVRYGEAHDVHHEWVYNHASIDASKVVWARELDPAQNRALLNYYKDRTVWLIQPENLPHLIGPYPAPEGGSEPAERFVGHPARGSLASSRKSAPNG